MTGISTQTVTEPFHATDRGEVIKAEYGKPGEATYRRVCVNLSAGTITFFRCHTPSRFMATGPDAEFSCRLEEIRGIGPTWVRPRDVGPVLEVVTPTGRARLPHAMSDFNSISEILEQTVAKSGNRLGWYEAAGAKEALALACGATLAAGAIWALPEMPRWAIAVIVWTMVFVLLAACGLYWRTKRTWW